MTRVHNPVNCWLAACVVVLALVVMAATISNCASSKPSDVESRMTALERQMTKLDQKVDGIWSEVQEIQRILREHGWWELPY